MHSIRRSSRAAFRSSQDACLYINGSQRAFSRTCVNSGRALPNFLEPSTPELSSLLSTLNSKVLLPLHLSKEQEKLVYKQANKTKLEADPIEVTLGDVTLPLEHLDRNHLPDRWQTFRDVVRQSETKEDGENALRMLEGFHNAGVKVRTGWQNTLIRRLFAIDMSHLVLKALQRVQATGLSMKDSEVLRNVVRGIHDKAALSDWDKEETTKALKMAKQVVELLEDPAHHGAPGRGELVSKDDHRAEPIVVALPTELAAELAQRHGGDVEETKRFASRLLSALKQSNYSERLNTIARTTSLSEADFSNGTKHLLGCVALSQDVFELIVIWNALSTSRKVLCAGMPSVAGTENLEAGMLKVIKDGLQALDRLKIRNGAEVSGARYANKEEANFAKCK